LFKKQKTGGDTSSQPGESIQDNLCVESHPTNCLHSACDAADKLLDGLHVSARAYNLRGCIAKLHTSGGGELGRRVAETSTQPGVLKLFFSPHQPLYQGSKHSRLEGGILPPTLTPRRGPFSSIIRCILFCQSSIILVAPNTAELNIML
jgi:hypothetical protein